MAKMKHRPLRKSEEGEWAGWQLTPEEVDARMKRSIQPFWTNWTQERRDSIQELYDAISLYCGGQRAKAFDPARVWRHPSQYLTPEQHEADHRLMKWLEEMHHAGLKRIITRVAGTIISDDPYPDQGQFLRAIDLHVILRSRDVTRRFGRRSNDA